MTAGELEPGGWARVHERICRGIGHDLNGRANALSGLVELLERKGADGSLTPYLREEADRMVRVAHLFGLVTGPPGGVEPVVLRRWLTDLLELHGFHRGLETVPTRLRPSADDPVVRTDPVALARLVLLAVSELSYATLDADATDEVVLSLAATEETVTLGIAAGGATGGREGDGSRGLRAAAKEVAGVTGLGVEAAPGGEGYRVTVTLRPLR